MKLYATFKEAANDFVGSVWNWKWYKLRIAISDFWATAIYFSLKKKGGKAEIKRLTKFTCIPMQIIHL